MATKKVTLTAETELQPDVVFEMLTKRGLIGDKRILNEKHGSTQVVVSNSRRDSYQSI